MLRAAYITFATLILPSHIIALLFEMIDLFHLLSAISPIPVRHGSVISRG